MERAVFGWPRWTGDVTWSGGSWLAGYPLANLGVLPLARVARSTNDDLASTQVIGTFSAARSVRAPRRADEDAARTPIGGGAGVARAMPASASH
jgi:hypothetical protein